MKFNFVFILFILVFDGYGQTLKKKEVRGVYERSTGDPARTIQKNDSNFISIPYVEYSRETLKLRRFGRLTLQYAGIQEGPAVVKKGKWKIEGDIIVVFFRGEVLKYTFRPPVYLESIEGKRGFQKNI